MRILFIFYSLGTAKLFSFITKHKNNITEPFTCSAHNYNFIQFKTDSILFLTILGAQNSIQTPLLSNPHIGPRKPESHVWQSLLRDARNCKSAHQCIFSVNHSKYLLNIVSIIAPTNNIIAVFNHFLFYLLTIQEHPYTMQFFILCHSYYLCIKRLPKCPALGHWPTNKDGWTLGVLK